jgi:hypothetical protein
LIEAPVIPQSEESPVAAIFKQMQDPEEVQIYEEK